MAHRKKQVKNDSQDINQLELLKTDKQIHSNIWIVHTLFLKIYHS